MTWRRIAYILYFVLVALMLPLLYFFSQGTGITTAHAGSIRKADLSPSRPLLVRLAPGRTTAISFAVKPEKVVPGNPQALEINFLGRDLTLRPLAPQPGNLIVYTKSARYVILLQLGSDGSYDDVVSVVSVNSGARPIRLDQDSFTIEKITIRSVKSDKETSIIAEMRQEGRILRTKDLPLALKCRDCLVRKRHELTEVACSEPILNLTCSSSGSEIRIHKGSQ